MDKKFPIAKSIIMVLAVIVGVIGFGVAHFITTSNIYIARGALGCAFIYLLSREVDFLFRNQSFEDLYNFPQAIRYLSLAFGLFVLFYFGLYEVIQLVLFVAQAFFSK
jgi:hypothetical protein